MSEKTEEKKLPYTIKCDMKTAKADYENRYGEGSFDNLDKDQQEAWLLKIQQELKAKKYEKQKVDVKKGYMLLLKDPRNLVLLDQNDKIENEFKLRKTLDNTLRNKVASELYNLGAYKTLGAAKTGVNNIFKELRETHSLLLKKEKAEQKTMTEEVKEKEEELRNLPNYEEAVKELRKKPLFYLMDRVEHLKDDPIKCKNILGICSAASPSRGDLNHEGEHGEPGKGKSSVQKKILKLLMPHRYDILTSISPKSIIYAKKAKKITPKTKVIMVDECETSKEAIPILRTLTASDEDIEVEHWTVTETREFESIRIPEVISIWINSVDTFDDNQLNSRLFIGNPDESEELDKEVKDFILKSYARPKKEEERFQTARIMFELVFEETKGLGVMIPFAEHIEFPDYKDRRNTKKFCKLILASARLHYKQRPIINNNILTSFDDFNIARYVWVELSKYQKVQLTEKYQEILAILPTSKENAISRKAIATALDKHTTTIKKYCEELEKRGKIDTDTELIDGKWQKTYWLKRGMVISDYNKIKIKPFSSVDMLNWLNSAYIKNGGHTNKKNSDEMYKKVSCERYPKFVKASPKPKEPSPEQNGKEQPLPKGDKGKQQKLKGDKGKETENGKLIVEEETVGRVFDVVAFLETHADDVPSEQILRASGWTEDELMKELNRLKERGEVFEPRPGRWKAT